MMRKEKLQIVKNYEFPIKGMSLVVRGQIVRSKSLGSGDLFYGSLSHYCKLSESAATAYIPSLIGVNQKAVERTMKAYIGNFTSIGVIENEYYGVVAF